VLDGSPAEMASELRRFVSPEPMKRPDDVPPADDAPEAEAAEAAGGSVPAAFLHRGAGAGAGSSRKGRGRLTISGASARVGGAGGERPPPRVLILSLGTDCAGLTLTCASHLFVLDPPLSPAVMSQLVGRICRQGQTRTCHVFHMVVKDSVEERMIAIRARLARGEASGGAADTAAVDAAARGLMRKGRVDASTAASTDRLSAAELLGLLESPAAAVAAAGGAPGR
jgi:hypothetical protein